MFILEVIMKKNDGTPASNAFTSFKSNLDGFTSILEKNNLFNSDTRDINKMSSAPNLKLNYPMLDCSQANLEDSRFLSSVNASPRAGFQFNLNYERQDTKSHMNSFDFFDNEIKPSRKPSTTSMPKLLIEDYINVTDSPKTASNYEIKNITHSHLLSTPKSENEARYK